MNMACPHCGATIALDDVNVATDLALCRTCGKTCSFSADMVGTNDHVPDLTVSPEGAWYEDIRDGFRVGATTRSWQAVFLIPFTCVWAGFSLSGLYGTQIRSGHWSLFPSLFGLPFLLGSVALITSCAMQIAGKCELTVHDDRLQLFIGLGSIGWTRHYLWSDFSLVREGTPKTLPAGIAPVAVSSLKARGRSPSVPYGVKNTATSS